MILFDDYSEDEVKSMLADGEITQDEAKNLCKEYKGDFGTGDE